MNTSRLNLLFPQRPSKNNLNPKPVTFETLQQQSQNFFLIGVDGKNPWGAQSHKLGPADVLNLTRSGITIRATPHIGLHWPSNSMYPHMRVCICDYMGNMAYVDKADEPENVKERFAKHNCAKQQKDEEVLSPYLELNPLAINGNGYISAKRFTGHTNLASVHHKAKIEALGEESVILDSDLLKFTWVHDFFQVLVENQVWILQGYDQRTGIFDRFINTNGTVNKGVNPGKVQDIFYFLEMKKNHSFMIREDCLLPTTGFLPIKEAVILLDSIVCYWEQKGGNLEHGGIGDTYTMSGVDMINYTKSQPLRDVLDRMYKSLLNSGKFSWLPKYLAHTILPGGTFRFLPCNAEQELLDSVSKLLLLYEMRNELNRNLSSEQDPNQRARLILESKEIVNPDFVRTRHSFREAVKNRRGFSQYDLLNGEYVPKEIIDRLMPMTFEEIQTLFKTE